MSEDDVDPPEQEGDDGQGTSDGEDETASSSAFDTPRRRSRRRYIEKAERDRLTEDWSFVESCDLSAPVHFTVRGGSVGQDRGSAEFIGEMMKRTAQLISQLAGGRPQISGLHFGHSVTFSFEPSAQEIRRAQLARQAYVDLVREQNVLPEEVSDVFSPDDLEDLGWARVRRNAVPDTLVGGFMAVDLVREAHADVVDAVLDFGTDVAASYRTFVSALATDDVEFVVQPPSAGEIAILNSSEASVMVRRLKETPEERQQRTVSVIGRLSVADADNAMFGLRLDPDVPRPRELKGIRSPRLTGRYTKRVGEVVERQNLWNKLVRARIRIERDPRGIAASVRPTEYVLIEVRPAYTD